MVTRKAICLVSGLFEEVNTPTDGLDFAGNTTADLTENTNLYYTDARSRAAISVTDSGGDGSLGYDSATGVFTYTGPSSADVRAHFSVADGSGLTYDSGTGEFGTSSIPNTQLANSSVTLGSTAVSLGATVTAFTGFTSLTSTTLNATTLNVPSSGDANSITISSGVIQFEGSTPDAYETLLRAEDPTVADNLLYLPDNSGTLLSTGSSIANANLANSSITIGSTSVALGDTQTAFTGLTSVTSTALIGSSSVLVGTADAANSILLDSSGITFEGSTADVFETTLNVVDPTADRAINLPDLSGTVALLESLSVATGSGLTYDNATGEFGTSSIPNAQLANSSVTVGSTSIALGSSATTIAGLTSVTSTAVVTNDSGFRIQNTTDTTKQIAFSASAIGTGQTRTLTVPDNSGTIATEDFATAIAIALG